TGVPQGSILGPLLFNVFVADMSWFVTNVDLKRYADNTNFAHFCNSLNDLRLEINADLLNITNWLKSNHMTLNTSKTVAMLMGKARGLEAEAGILINSMAPAYSDNIKMLVLIFD